MRYSIEIDGTVDALAYCMRKINNEVDDICDWTVNVNAGGIDYGIYFNFDIDNKKLEICNQPKYDDSLYIDEIIDKINGEDEED